MDTTTRLVLITTASIAVLTPLVLRTSIPIPAQAQSTRWQDAWADMQEPTLTKEDRSILPPPHIMLPPKVIVPTPTPVEPPPVKQDAPAVHIAATKPAPKQEHKHACVRRKVYHHHQWWWRCR